MDILTEKQKIMVQDPLFYEKIEIFRGYWTSQNCIDNPKTLFVFGDNDSKFGKGGQAVIRDCKNSAGIPTKKYPSNADGSFYTDSELSANIENIDKAIKNIINRSIYYEIIMFPEDGFGTGLAKLEEKAPRTFAHLNHVINRCFYLRY